MRIILCSGAENLAALRTKAAALQKTRLMADVAYWASWDRKFAADQANNREEMLYWTNKSRELSDRSAQLSTEEWELLEEIRRWERQEGQKCYNDCFTSF